MDRIISISMWIDCPECGDEFWCEFKALAGSGEVPVSRARCSCCGAGLNIEADLDVDVEAANG